MTLTIILKANPDILGLTAFPENHPSLVKFDDLSSDMLRDFEISRRNSIQYGYWQYVESSENRSGNSHVSYSKDVRLAFYPIGNDAVGWIINIIDGSDCQEAWMYENSTVCV